MSDTPITSARFVGASSRSETIKLDFPIEIEGKTIETVTVSRLTVAQVEQFFTDFADLKEKDPEAAGKLALPMCDVPAEIISLLDDDDGARVQECIARFLPRRFKELTSASTSPAGETSS